MIEKLQDVIKHYDELAHQMSLPDAMINMKQFTRMAREHSAMTELVNCAKQFIQNHNQLQEYEEILSGNDEELKDIVKEEINDLKSTLIQQEERLKILLITKDPNDSKNIILEIRSGTGGDEAALFAGNLYRMYLRFSERNSWKSELMSINDNSKCKNRNTKA